MELCLGPLRLNSVPRTSMVRQHPVFFLGWFFKYPIKKELKTYPSLTANCLPEKMISVSFFTWLALMPWWKVSDISRERSVYILSCDSFNIASESLSSPKLISHTGFCSHTGFLRSPSQNIPLFETGRSHQPTFSSKHQMCNILTPYRSSSSPEALYILVSSIL